MNHAARLARLESAGIAGDRIAALFARFDVSPDVDPTTLTDPIQRAGVAIITSMIGQPGGVATVTAYLDAVAVFGTEHA